MIRQRNFSQIHASKVKPVNPSWPLKAKYLPEGALRHRTQVDPPEGTWTYGRKSKSRTGGNAGKAQKNRAKALRPRRKSYGPIWSPP